MSALVWLNRDGPQQAIAIAVNRNDPKRPGTVEFDRVINTNGDKVSPLESLGHGFSLTATEARRVAGRLETAAIEAEKTDYRRIENAEYALLGVPSSSHLRDLVAPIVDELQVILRKINDGEL